jgi:hypothetical protein
MQSNLGIDTIDLASAQQAVEYSSIVGTLMGSSKHIVFSSQSQWSDLIFD